MQFKTILVVAIMLLLDLTSNLKADVPYTNADLNEPTPVDSADIAHYGKKNWKLATSQVIASNIGVWAFNRYVTNADFARINLNTMRTNLRKGFVWDNDQMSTNMFGHPYQGNLYFNAARSNGYNFWQSSLFAVGGSAMWELFMENEYPSINDFIVTPVGGAAVGEVFHRTSDLILDDRTIGSERFWRETASFIINPARGVTRLINGDIKRHRSTSGKLVRKPDIKVEWSAGVRVLEFNEPLLDRGAGFSTHVSLEYGDRFDDSNKLPFDYFTITTFLNFQKQQPLLSQFNIEGRLLVEALVDNKKDFLSIGLYQHFDYYDSDTISYKSGRIPYKIGVPASIGGGLMYQSKRFRNFHFDAYYHLNAVLLGASLSDHYVVDNRNYNLGSGFSTKVGFKAAYKDKLQLSFYSDNYWIYTWKGYPEDMDWSRDPHEINYQGDHSQAILNVIGYRIDLKLKNNFYLSNVSNSYIRNTKYRYKKDVSTTVSDTHLMLTYKF